MDPVAQKWRQNLAMHLTPHTLSSYMEYYHNPKCSKSRAALAILTEHKITPSIHEYLETPYTKDQLSSLLRKLSMTPRQLVRTSEPEYESLKLQEASDDDILTAMVEHPQLVERPILVNGNKAIIGRPPERVLELIQDS